MASPRLIPLTLIVATSPNLGIGLRGALPWRLKSELQYFARVTTRVPPPADDDEDGQGRDRGAADPDAPEGQRPAVQNANPITGRTHAYGTASPRRPGGGRLCGGRLKRRSLALPGRRRRRPGRPAVGAARTRRRPAAAS